MRRNEPILGLVDLDASRIGTEVLGHRVIGGDDAVLCHPAESLRLANGVGSVRSTAARRGVFLRFSMRGYRFVTVVHPAAVVATNAELGEGVQLMAGAIVQPGVRIGRDAIVNTGATVDHDCRIGDHVHIAPGATLSGDVEIGEGTHVGAGATVIQGVRIGASCVVGAGALVLRNVADGATVVGVPAREIRR